MGQVSPNTHSYHKRYILSITNVFRCNSVHLLLSAWDCVRIINTWKLYIMYMKTVATTKWKVTCYIDWTCRLVDSTQQLCFIDINCCVVAVNKTN